MKVKAGLAIGMMFFTSILFAQSGRERVIPIDSVLVLVERNSTQLKLSEKYADAAQQLVSVVKNNKLPSVDVGLSALYLGDATILDRNFSNSVNAAMPHFGNNFSIEASYLVFAGGAVTNSIAKAELEARIANLSYQQTLADMRFLVVGNYLDLFKLQNQRKVFLKNIEQTQALIKEVTARQKEGMALVNDITRHELMLQNLKLTLVEIENNMSIINQNLITTLGLPADTKIMADTTIQNMTLEPLAKDELMKIAGENRPELLKAALSKSVADTQVRLTKAICYPSVALIAANNFTGPITIEIPPIDKNFNYWFIGVGVKYNLASLYKSGKEMNLAKSGQSIAESAQVLAKENTRVAVHAALTKFLESFEKLRTYEKNFQLAIENYTIVNNRYKNDLVLITEMLDASNIKLNAELQVVNANLDVIYNRYKLMREIGKL